jgi:hypothetical protein
LVVLEQVPVLQIFEISFFLEQVMYSTEKEGKETEEWRDLIVLSTKSKHKGIIFELTLYLLGLLVIVDFSAKHWLNCVVVCFIGRRVNNKVGDMLHIRRLINSIFAVGANLEMRTVA